MKIKITGLRFPEFHDENSKKRKQIGQVGEVGGNGYVGFYFIPDRLV